MQIPSFKGRSARPARAGASARHPAGRRRGPFTLALMALMALMAALGGASAATAPAPSAEALFDWAEKNYPGVLPGHRASQAQPPYTYRHYPATGNYIGVAGADVYVLGPVSGGALQRVGALADFTCLVAPTACPHGVPAATGLRARMAMGTDYTLAVLPTGEVLVWGAAATGQRTPVAGTVAWRIDGVRDATAVHVGSFQGTNLALTRNGRVMGWGVERYGNLGTGSSAPTNAVNVPVQVPGLADIVDIVPTGGLLVTYYALRADGTVWTAPSSERGPARQVDGLPAIAALSELQINLRSPRGTRFTYGIDGSGQVWQIVDEGGPGVVVQRMSGLSGIAQVSCTDDHCLALDTQGDVWSWGANDMGQLGDGSRADREQPRKVAGLGRVSKVLATGHASFALTASALYSWGYQLTGKDPVHTTPAAVATHANSIVDLYPSFDIPAGSRFMVHRDGRVTANGLNATGTLGDGTLRSAVDDAAPVTVYGVNLGGI